MSRVITFAGGMCFAPPAPAPFGCSSAVELEPSLLSPAGPAFSPSSSACSPSFPGNFNSSAANSPSGAASTITKIKIIFTKTKAPKLKFYLFAVSNHNISLM
uniref:Uncharacterized protein n=1 Tax=Cajanus cajan TaxID=3821 RepID=A0A151T1I6_CAJCA|nr:hypothetical protein KK1_023336 [Cajanus cajan]